MATVTMEQEKIQLLIETLNLSNEDGGSLVGDVQEGFEHARMSMRNPTLGNRVRQLAVLSQDFNKWYKSLCEFKTNEEQRRVAQGQEESIVQTLKQMKKAVAEIYDASNTNGSSDTRAISRSLTELWGAVNELNEYFQEASGQQRTEAQPTSSPPLQHTNLPYGMRNPTSRTDSQRTGSGFSPPPPQRNTGTNYSYSNAIPPRFNARHSTTFGTSSQEPRSSRNINELNSDEDSRVVAGDWRDPTTDSASASRSSSFNIGKVNTKGRSFTILGDVHSPGNPFDN